MTQGSGLATAPRAGLRPISTIAYVLPFALFLALLAVLPFLPMPQVWGFALHITVAAAALVVFSRGAVDFGVSRPAGTVLIGVGVFLLWIAPDLLFPGYREHWLFTNTITGAARSTLDQDAHRDALALALRSLRAVAIVPIIEELFWRGWMMRWLIKPAFQTVPLGAWGPRAFWITALLFASEHGSYWDVGLAAGVLYNWWMVRTRRLGDLIWAHAITNACLCAYIITAHKWEYWL